MKDIERHPDDFAKAFESAFARLQISIETACVSEPDWPAQVAAGLRAALDFAATDPASARVLTIEAMAAGNTGHARYNRMIAHFGEQLLPGRAISADGERLPGITERAVAGGVAMLVAQHLDRRPESELPGLAPEATQFVLTPYLGAEWARRVAVASR